MAEYRASFGDAEFNILITSADGHVPGWGDQPNIIVTPIPGADPPRTEVEVVWPQGPSQATWRLHVHDATAYQALRAKIATIDTLTVPARIQAQAGVETTIDDVLSVLLPETLLMNLGTPVTRLDGSFDIDATFMRQINAATGDVVTLT